MMAEDHERIEELLAGHALLSLDGEDAAEVDRLLADHVPTCLTCRQTIRDLRELTGDLALSADPVQPPDLVIARIRRGMDDVPVTRGGRGGWARRGAVVAIAASLVGLVAMGGLSVVMAGRASRADDRTTTALEVLSLMRSPGVDPVSVDPQGSTPKDSGFLGVPADDVRRLYVTARLCPEPSAGHAYQLWLGSDGEFAPFGRMFTPTNGFVLLELVVDVSRYDEIWITEEIAGQPAAIPSTTGRSWRAAIP
jgi:Anti-sigma-K factor rskA